MKTVRVSGAAPMVAPSEHQAGYHERSSRAQELSLAPPQEVNARDLDNLHNRNVALLLALLLAQSTRELSKMQREAAKSLLQGEVALFTAMIRLEPEVARFLEDVRFLKAQIMGWGSVALSAAPMAGGLAKGAYKKLSTQGAGRAQGKKKVSETPGQTLKPFDLKSHLAGFLAQSRLASWSAVRDRLILRNERARYVLARNAAEAQLGTRMRSTPDLREAWLKVHTDKHAKRMVKEAMSSRGPRLDRADWSSSSQPSTIGRDARALARDVFGVRPTPKQLGLIREAVQVLRSGGDPILGRLLPMKDRLMSREALASHLEKWDGASRRAKLTTDPDRLRLARAIRGREVDLSQALYDRHGKPTIAAGSSSRSGLSGVASQLNKSWDDGWAHEQAEVPEGIRDIGQEEKQILDAWYQEMLSARLDLIRWSSRFADVFSDVSSVDFGHSDH